MMSPQARYVSPDRDHKLPSLSNGDQQGAKLSGDINLEQVSSSGKLLHWDMAQPGRTTTSHGSGKQGKKKNNSWAANGSSNPSHFATLLAANQDDATYAHPMSLHDIVSSSPYSNALPPTKAKGIYCTRAAVVAAASHSSAVTYRSTPATTTLKKGGGALAHKFRQTAPINTLLREVKTSGSPFPHSLLGGGTTVVVGAQVNTIKEHVPHKLFMSQQLAPRVTPIPSSSLRDTTLSTGYTGYQEEDAVSAMPTGFSVRRSTSSNISQSGGSTTTADADSPMRLRVTSPRAGDGPPSPTLPQLGNNNLVHHSLVAGYPSTPSGTATGPASLSDQSRELQAAVALARSKAKAVHADMAPAKINTPRLPNTLMYNNTHAYQAEAATPKAYYPKPEASPGTFSVPLEKGHHPVLRRTVPPQLYIPPATTASTLTIGAGGKLEAAALPHAMTVFNIFDKSSIVKPQTPVEHTTMTAEANPSDTKTVGGQDTSGTGQGQSPGMDASGMLGTTPSTSTSLPMVSPPPGTFIDHFPSGTPYSQPGTGSLHATRYQIFTPAQASRPGVGNPGLGKELHTVIEGVKTDIGHTPSSYQVLAIPKSKFINSERAGPLPVLRPQDLLPKLIAEKNDPRPVTPCTAHLTINDDDSKYQVKGTQVEPLPRLAAAKQELKPVPLPQMAMAASLASKRAIPMAVRTPMYARRAPPTPGFAAQQLNQEQSHLSQPLPPTTPGAGAVPATDTAQVAGVASPPAQAQSSTSSLTANSISESLLPSNVVLDLNEVLGERQPSASMDASSAIQMQMEQKPSRPGTTASGLSTYLEGDYDIEHEEHGSDSEEAPGQQAPPLEEVSHELDTMLDSILGSLPERIATPASGSGQTAPRSAAPSHNSRPPTQQGTGAGPLNAGGVGAAKMLRPQPVKGSPQEDGAPAGTGSPRIDDFSDIIIPNHPTSAPVILRSCATRSLSALGGGGPGQVSSLLSVKGAGKGAYGADPSNASLLDSDDSELDDAEYVDLDNSDVEGSAALLSVSAYGISPMRHLDPNGRAPNAESNQVNDQVIDGNRILGQKYKVQHMVGEGAYGMVTKCKVIGKERYVAIKEFKIEDDDPDADDVKRTSKREVSLLRTLRHPNVVELVDEFYVRDHLFIVMEFVPCNLLELLEAQPGGMDREAVRLIMYQLCTAMSFIHGKNVVFRDIKPENILVDEHGQLKLCDFGFARFMNGPGESLTDYVATRWYRAPELLLGPPYRRMCDGMDGKYIQSMYGPPVDMWAIGCVFGELMDGDPLFAGDSDLDQLYKVQQILGPMSSEHQAMFNENPHNTGIVFNIKHPSTLASRYGEKMTDVELDFMAGLLHMDPKLRFTADACLAHPYLADLVASDRRRARDARGSACNSMPSTPSGMTTPTDLGDSTCTSPLPGVARMPAHQGSAHSRPGSNGRPVFNSSGRASKLSSAQAASTNLSARNSLASAQTTSPSLSARDSHISAQAASPMVSARGDPATEAVPEVSPAVEEGATADEQAAT